jgi:hypothetical protein
MHGQSPSILSSGNWYKLSVQADGVYKIDYSLLRKIGINPDAIDPKKIQMHAGMNGMLPQSNSAPRIYDLKQLSIYVRGADDGRFNTDDYILFFGQGPDIYQVPAGKTVFQYQNNIYTDKNYYFLTIGAADGLRTGLTANIPGTFPTVAEYDDIGYFETESYNDLHSGRDWFGEEFDTKTEYTIRFDMPGIVANSSVMLVSNVMGQSYGPSSVQLSYNGVLIGEQVLPAILNSQYAPKGAEVTDTLFIGASSVNAAAQGNQDIKLKFIKATTDRSVAYIDYVLLQAKRKLSLSGDQTVFHSLKSLEQPTTLFSLSSMTSDGTVWDVTDPFAAAIQETSFSAGVMTFAAVSTSLRKYVAFANRNFPVPAVEGAMSNQNLHGIASLDFLIVTAPEFLSEASRLAAYRQSHNSLNTIVVTTTQVYNEFSGGKQDVTAIRDFAKYLRDRGAGLKTLLLFGRGSYDYKNYLPYNKNFVPTYESRNSLSPLETYSSDDYFGFLENSEGNWGESPPEAHTLDIAVGRLPVKKIEEAQAVVDKLIRYESQNWGPWRKEILFVADDGDFNIHQGQADALAESLETNHPEFNTQKIFLDAFKQVNSPIGQVSPQATTALNDAVRHGVAIVNYTGHGGEQQWTQERILDQVSLDEWKTAPHYPFLVTATCEFGRNDDPGLISTAELSIIKKDGGSIGMVTTARPVNSSTNFTLNTSFYQALFTKQSNQFRDIGSVFVDTKNNSISGVSNRNFALLGDPSMKLALPPPEIKITSQVNITSGSDTLKALSKIRMNGMIYSNGVPDPGFSGTLTATLFEKATSQLTKGDDNPPFSYNAREGAAFRGQANVFNGQFAAEFTIPGSIDITVGTTKLSLYASSTSGIREVAGVSTTLKIGSIEKNPAVDSKGPQIELYMGDTTFVSGGIAGSNSRIVAVLTDENGINTATFTPQKNIVATLDDTVSITLNKYYESDIDNVRRGKLAYPIDHLKPGQHNLTLRASDTYGNTSSESISFYVSEQNGILVEQWLNYPNPFTSTTTFHFKHNRSGEDLEAVVTIFNQTGQPILSNTYQIPNSPYQVDLPAWDGSAPDGTKFGAGLYLLKLSVRSLLDGSKNEKITKVIIFN